jgi:hypothetical protein
MRTVVFVLMVVVAGCTAPSDVPATPSTTEPVGAIAPDAALRDLFVALTADDFETVDDLVIEEQVALMIALEGASASEAATMLRDGVTRESEVVFWTAFRDTFPRSRRETLDELIVAEQSRFAVDDVEFALIDVSLRSEPGLSHWVVQRVDDRWRVDLFATFGSVVAVPLRLWLVTLSDDADTEEVRAAIARQRPSLLTALQRRPLGPIDPGTAEQIRGLLVDVGAGSS